MKNIFIFLFTLSVISFSCSNDDLEEDVVGDWILELIRIEGGDCQSIFSSDVPTEYLADSEGCAIPLEVLGNARRCVNIKLLEDGTGFFLWSEISGSEDTPITYTFEGGVMKYCAGNFSCSGEYRMVGDRLENDGVPLSLEGDCRAVRVIRRK